MRGGSQSQLMRASDGAFYVVKFQNNPQHIRVLANEFIAGRLAKLLGLPVPEVRIIEVSDWLVGHTPEMRINRGNQPVPCSSGRQLASFYSSGELDGGASDYLPESLLAEVENLGDFARMLVFDKWTSNEDGRQAIFRKLRGKRRYRATFIDHGYCFGGGTWGFNDSPRGGVFASTMVYRQVRGWRDFEPVLERAAHTDIDQLWSCATGLPEEWYEGDRSGLERLIEGLSRRRSGLHDLIDHVRRSSRAPFPDWQDEVRLVVPGAAEIDRCRVIAEQPPKPAAGAAEGG
jgi:hypothetical protein